MGNSQGYAEHAGLIGLTDRCLPMSSRDALTGEVKHFPSAIECARSSGLTKDAVLYRLKVGEERLFPEMKQYRIGHSEKEWASVDNVDLALEKNGTRKRVLLRDYSTGDQMEFTSASELAAYLSVPISTLSCWLSSADQPLLPGMVQLKWKDDSVPWRKIDDIYLEVEKYSGKRPVVAIGMDSIHRIYYSAKDCSVAMNLLPTTLNNRLKSKGKTVFSDGYRYVYYSDFLESIHGHLEQ